LTAFAVAALVLAGGQLGLAGSAHADGLAGYTFDYRWDGGKEPQTLPQNFDYGHSFQLDDDGAPATTPANVNVLVTYTLGAPKLDGTDVPDLPVGFTSTLSDGDCTPAAQAATGTGTAAFICDLDQPGSNPYASFEEHIGSTTPDGTILGITATIVPHGDDTLAKVEADQRAGAQFASMTDLTHVESLAEAQQDSVTTQVAGFAAGQTATETVAVHAVDHGTVTLRTSSATPGEVWTDPNAQWIDGQQDVFLPQGLTATAIDADGGATCSLVPAEYQNSLNNYSANSLDLAYCDVTPDTTAITLTFAAAASLPQTPVQLTAGYHVFENTQTPFTTSTGDFTVTAAS
jgi:hypothetical protein